MSQHSSLKSKHVFKKINIFKRRRRIKILKNLGYLCRENYIGLRKIKLI